MWAVEEVEDRAVLQGRIPLSSTLRRSLGTLRAGFIRFYSLALCRYAAISTVIVPLFACDESVRVTVLSVASFLRTVPYIGLAPLIGFLNNKGLLSVFLVGWSALTILALIFFLWDETSQKRRNRISGSLTS